MPQIHTFFIYAFWGWMGHFSEERVLGLLDEGETELADAHRPTWVVRNGLELVGVTVVAANVFEVRLVHLGAKSSDGRHAVSTVAKTLREFSPHLTVSENWQERAEAAAK